MTANINQHVKNLHASSVVPLAVPSIERFFSWHGHASSGTRRPEGPSMSRFAADNSCWPRGRIPKQLGLGPTLSMNG